MSLVEACSRTASCNSSTFCARSDWRAATSAASRALPSPCTTWRGEARPGCTPPGKGMRTQTLRGVRPSAPPCTPRGRPGRRAHSSTRHPLPARLVPFPPALPPVPPAPPLPREWRRAPPRHCRGTARPSPACTGFQHAGAPGQCPGAGVRGLVIDSAENACSTRPFADHHTCPNPVSNRACDNH